MPTKAEHHQCPCFDYLSLAKRGHYLICHICFREDDGIDIDDLDAHSGPNHISLREGRANFEAFGACASKMLKHVLPKEKQKSFLRETRIT